MSLPEKLAPELFPMEISSGFRRGFMTIMGELEGAELQFAARFRLTPEEEASIETTPLPFETSIQCPYCKQKHQTTMGLPATIRCIEAKCGVCDHVFIALRLGLSHSICTSCRDRVDCLSLPITGIFQQRSKKAKRKVCLPDPT